MGPRSRERGRVLRGSVFGHAHQLQWGRVRENAEGAAVLRHAARRARFNGAAFARTRKGTWSWSRTTARTSFNGAAFARTRKDALQARPRVHPGASMGPRSRERGRLAVVTVPVPVSGLQWGRVRENAEGPGRPKGSASVIRLQWGRVRENAEGLHGHHPVGVRGREASMGPRSRERGRRDAGRCGLGQAMASMGPRSRERGRLFSGTCASAAGTLQWGRVRENAEGVDAQRPCVPVTALQWGRVRENAEGVGSMTSLLVSIALQWGRVRENAEGAIRSPSSLRSRRRFNGAAFARTRKGG